MKIKEVAAAGPVVAHHNELLSEPIKCFEHLFVCGGASGTRYAAAPPLSYFVSPATFTLSNVIADCQLSFLNVVDFFCLIPPFLLFCNF